MTAQNLPLTIRPARKDDEAFLVGLTPRLADFPLPAWRTAEEIAQADRQLLRDALTGALPHSAILVAEPSPGGERAGYVFATTKHDYAAGVGANVCLPSPPRAPRLEDRSRAARRAPA